MRVASCMLPVASHSYHIAKIHELCRTPLACRCAVDEGVEKGPCKKGGGPIPAFKILHLENLSACPPDEQRFLSQQSWLFSEGINQCMCITSIFMMAKKPALKTISPPLIGGLGGRQP